MLRYDPSWSIINCQNYTNPPIYLLPDGNGTVTTSCGQGVLQPGQANISVTSSPTSGASEVAPTVCGGTLSSTQSATADGVAGTVQYYSPQPGATQQSSCAAVLGYQEVYTFVTGGNTYWVWDQETLSSPDVRALVYTMVTQTLQFS